MFRPRWTLCTKCCSVERLCDEFRQSKQLEWRIIRCSMRNMRKSQFIHCNVCNFTNEKFYILVTVHHVMILGKWTTRYTKFFYVFTCISKSLHVSSTLCSSSEETNYINTDFGNSHSMLVDETSAGWTKSLLPTCTQLGHQHRVTATRGCIDTNCLSWWWARCARNMQRVKNKNKYTEKNCASRWSFTKNN